jgi:Holliday junction resolvase RusA-like endonuclease
MTESVKIVLPLPCRALSPNGRVNHFAKARATKRYRQLARDAVEAAQLDSIPWPRAEAFVTFYWPCNRKRDEDNAIASLKAAYDGLVDAGLILDDNSEHLKRHMPDFAIDAEHPRVEMVVKRLSTKSK